MKFRITTLPILELEAKELIDNFTYYPDSSKNIIPMVSSLQEIFDVTISNSIDAFGIKKQMGFNYCETLSGDSIYSAFSYDLVIKKEAAPESYWDNTSPVFYVQFENGVFSKEDGAISTAFYEVQSSLEFSIKNRVNYNNKNIIVNSCHLTFSSCLIKHKLKGKHAEIS
jgi:hypothetical protein